MTNKTILIIILTLVVSQPFVSAEEAAKINDVVTPKPAEEVQKFYKVIDKQGRVSYSDQPSKNAVEIKTNLIPKVKIKTKNISLKELVRRNEIDALLKNNPSAYYELKFVNLKNDDILRNDHSKVTLSASLYPSLKKGDSISFFLDGQLMKSKGALSVTFNQVDYGAHTANFIILSSERVNLAQSDSVKFQLLPTVTKKVR